MRLIATLFGLKLKAEDIFEPANGKTLAEYRQEQLVKMGKRQFEKLDTLGLSIPVQLS